MNETQIRSILLNLDSDLLDQELDILMDKIEIDVDSILTRSQAKLLEKKHEKMKKIKLIPIVAAIVCLMAGTTIVYADDISDFLKSFLGKSTVYSTVVDETTYYLETPVDLDSGGKITSVMFTEKYLTMAISTDANEIAVSVGDGNEYKPQGYSNGPNGKEFTFFELPLAQSIVVTLDEKEYSIHLSQSAPAVANGDIISAQPNSVDWINMGYKRTEKGVQIFTSFADQDLRLVRIGSPVNREVKDTFDNQTNTSGSQLSSAKPIFGYDKKGNAYEYVYEKNPLAWPVTRFESDAPAMEEITLKIPEVIVGYNKVFEEISVDIPAVNSETHPNLEIDLEFQKMVLQNITRTSANTVKLEFVLNTGDARNVFIYQADMESADGA